MKRCKKCGALQNDSHVVCIDCGGILGPPLSKQEEKEAELEVSKKINDLNNKKDYFYVSKPDKAVGILLILGAVLFLLLKLFMFFKVFFGYNFEDNYGVLPVFAAILMLIEAFKLLIPSLSWELYKLKFVFSVNNTEDIQPSTLALYTKRITSYAVCLLGYAYLIFCFILIIMS